MRHFKNWIGAFLEYTSGKPSPYEFRLWAGISAVAAGLQRRCFTHIMETNLYPNLFILLVSNPGVGKSMAIRAARETIRSDPRIKLAPQRCSKEQFYDEIESAAINSIDAVAQQAITMHSLTAMIDEFGVFVRRGDLDFMADLADLYDCPDPFEYKTKYASKLQLRRTWFNFISGCTPNWLKESFTEVALEQGFPARIIAVYSEQSSPPDLFRVKSDDSEKAELLTQLREDISEIMAMEGEFVWEKDAAEAFQKWVNNEMRPYPPDPRLKHYNTRRVIHIPKITMVMSAARRSTLTVTLEDFRAAQKVLLEAELQMHKAYTAIGKNQYFSAVDAVVKLVKLEYARTKKAVPEYKLVRALQRDVPFQYVMQILDQLINSRALEFEGIAPNRLFYCRGGSGGDRERDSELGDYGERPALEDGEETTSDSTITKAISR